MAKLKRRFFLVRLLHIVFWAGFIGLYFKSFYEPGLVIHTLLLAAGVLISWIPYKDCPLSVWENKLRLKINPRAEPVNFFPMNRWLNRRLGGKLSPYFTLYLLVGVMLLRVTFRY